MKFALPEGCGFCGNLTATSTKCNQVQGLVDYEQIGETAMPYSFIALPLPVELEILELLWQQGNATTKELHELLVAQRSVTYRTVKTTLTIMQEKGLLEKSQLYYPATYGAKYSRSEFQDLVLVQMARMFFYDDMACLLRAVLGHPNFQEKGNRHSTQYLNLIPKQIN
jgi:BlaI family transcriptional regulator, penicillinase repressor